MPIYELACEGGHRSETLQPSTAPLPACPGTAAVPPPPERMPQTWKGTHRGDRDYVTHLRRTADARRDLEARNPELATDRRPALAHEGRFEGSPLRAGDPAPPPPTGAGAAGEGSAT